MKNDNSQDKKLLAKGSFAYSEEEKKALDNYISQLAKQENKSVSQIVSSNSQKDITNNKKESVVGGTIRSSNDQRTGLNIPNTFSNMDPVTKQNVNTIIDTSQNKQSNVNTNNTSAIKTAPQLNKTDNVKKVYTEVEKMYQSEFGMDSMIDNEKHDENKLYKNDLKPIAPREPIIGQAKGNTVVRNSIKDNLEIFNTTKVESNNTIKNGLQQNKIENFKKVNSEVEKIYQDEVGMNKIANNEKQIENKLQKNDLKPVNTREPVKYQLKDNPIVKTSLEMLTPPQIDTKKENISTLNKTDNVKKINTEVEKMYQSEFGMDSMLDNEKHDDSKLYKNDLKPIAPREPIIGQAKENTILRNSIKDNLEMFNKNVPTVQSKTLQPKENSNINLSKNIFEKSNPNLVSNSSSVKVNVETKNIKVDNKTLTGKDISLSPEVNKQINISKNPIVNSSHDQANNLTFDKARSMFEKKDSIKSNQNVSIKTENIQTKNQIEKPSSIQSDDKPRATLEDTNPLKQDENTKIIIPTSEIKTNQLITNYKELNAEPLLSKNDEKYITSSSCDKPENEKSYVCSDQVTLTSEKLINTQKIECIEKPNLCEKIEITSNSQTTDSEKKKSMLAMTDLLSSKLQGTKEVKLNQAVNSNQDMKKSTGSSDNMKKLIEDMNRQKEEMSVNMHVSPLTPQDDSLKSVPNAQITPPNGIPKAPCLPPKIIPKAPCLPPKIIPKAPCLPPKLPGKEFRPSAKGEETFQKESKEKQPATNSNNRQSSTGNQMINMMDELKKIQLKKNNNI